MLLDGIVIEASESQGSKVDGSDESVIDHFSWHGSSPSAWRRR